LLIDPETFTASTHKSTFWVEFWFHTQAIVLPGLKSLKIYFRTCSSMLHIKITFPVFFSLWFAINLRYTANTATWLACSGVQNVFRTSQNCDILNIRVSRPLLAALYALSN